MIWYLIICGFDPFKSDCTFSPAFISQNQCEYVQSIVESIDPVRNTRCVGVKKN